VSRLLRCRWGSPRRFQQDRSPWSWTALRSWLGQPCPGGSPWGLWARAVLA